MEMPEMEFIFNKSSAETLDLNMYDIYRRWFNCYNNVL